MNKLGLAISIAAEAFSEITDRGGEPYILHCLWVMHRVDTNEEKQAAVLHDLIEDTPWTLNDLASEGLSGNVIKLIDNLTKREGESYDKFIVRVTADCSSMKIKKMDIRHNSNVSRLKGFTQKDANRIIKYQLAYKYLSTLDQGILKKLERHVAYTS